MTTPTHFFGGYLVLSLTKKLWSDESFSENTQKGLFVYGLVFSLAIDLDVFVAGGITDHHKLLPHYPLFWLLVFLALFSIGKLFKQKMIESITVITLVCAMMHLTLDLVGVTMGIHLLWPFSMREFSITPLKTEFASESERLAYIFRSPVMWIGDSLIILLSILKIITDYKSRFIKSTNP